MAYTPPSRTTVNFALTATTPPSRTNVNFEFNDSSININETITASSSEVVLVKSSLAINETLSILSTENTLSRAIINENSLTATATDSVLRSTQAIINENISTTTATTSVSISSPAIINENSLTATSTDSVTKRSPSIVDEPLTASASDIGTILYANSINENLSINSSQDATSQGFSVTYFGNGNTGGTPPTDSSYYTSGSTVTVLGNTGNLVKVA
jgi:Zn-dependent metalloprotease